MFQLPLPEHIQTNFDILSHLEGILEQGCDFSAGEDVLFRNLLGAYSEQWKAQGMKFQWSLKALGTLFYLDSVEDGRLPWDKLPALDPPRGLRFNGGKIFKPYDIFQFLNLFARRWRQLEIGKETLAYARRMEVYLAHARHVLYPVPEHTEPLQRACDQLCHIFKAEFIFRDLLGGEEQLFDSPRASDKLVKYLETQGNVIRGGQPNNPEIKRLFLGVDAVPGEDDAHARMEHGVFSDSHRDIFETQRSTVATETVWASTHTYNLQRSLGVLNFYSINSMMKRTCRFNWVSSVLLTDLDMATDTIFDKHYVTDPWIVVLMGHYYIRDPINKKTYKTSSSADAIACWFSVFWDLGDENKGSFFDGLKRYDLTRIPSSIPFSRRGVQKGELLWSGD